MLVQEHIWLTFKIQMVKKNNDNCNKKQRKTSNFSTNRFEDNDPVCKGPSPFCLLGQIQVQKPPVVVATNRKPNHT